MRHQKQIGDRREFPIFGLNFRVKQPVLRDATEVFSYADKITHTKVPHGPRHHSSHGVAQDSRGGQRNRGTEQDPDEAQHLAAHRIAHRHHQG